MANPSTSTPTLTIGIDLGDRFSYFCVLDEADAEILAPGVSVEHRAFGLCQAIRQYQACTHCHRSRDSLTLGV